MVVRSCFTITISVYREEIDISSSLREFLLNSPPADDEPATRPAPAPLRPVKRRAWLCALVLCSLLGLIYFPYDAELIEPLIGPFRDSTSDYDFHIRNMSVRYMVDHRLLKAVIRTESNFDCRAVSSKGAMGLMQLMPSTAWDMGVRHPFNPEENIRGGTRYLKSLLARFKNNVPMALAAYNAGPEAVKRHRGVPPYHETRLYLKKVMKHYAEYKRDASTTM